MSSEQGSTDSSVPTAVLSQGDESEETDAAHIAYNTGIPISEVIDHSKDANAETTSLELKQKGNDELMAGHYLKAVKLYSRLSSIRLPTPFYWPIARRLTSRWRIMGWPFQMRLPP